MIKVIETGRNPTMRYIGRTHGVSVAWLHETFKSKDLDLAYEISSRMCADIYTKAFTDPDKWKLARWLISVCDLKELNAFAKQSQEWNTTPPQSGGNSQPENPTEKTGGTTKTFAGAGLSNNLGGGGHVGGTGATKDASGQPVGGSGATKAETEINKPHKSKELRVGRRFSYKQQTHNSLYNILKKTFPKQKKDEMAQNSGTTAVSSSETELRYPGGELDWTTSTSSRLKPQEERLVRALNELVEERVTNFDDDFVWAGFRVTSGDRPRTFNGSARTGLSVAMVFVEPARGNSANGVAPERHTIRVVDGHGSHTPVESVGQSFLVEAFMPDLAHADDEHKQYLKSLGFKLSRGGVAGDTAVGSGSASVGGAGVTKDRGPTANNPGGCYKALVSQAFDRVLVEGCCEHNSLLQRKTRFSKKCKVIPITKDDDFASESGIRKCIEAINGPADSFWLSAPCTGGSTWQYINLKRGPETVAKIKMHWKLFKRLWAAFEIVASHALEVGARVFIEWPRRCAYWQDGRVRKFLARHGFKKTDFDGCMYGLVAQRGRDAGMPIQKPWTVACSPGSCLPRLLNKKCDRSHDHTPCAGQNTLLTQGYTQKIVDIVHQSITQDIATMNKANRLPDGNVDPLKTIHYDQRALLSVGLEEMSEAVALTTLA